MHLTSLYSNPVILYQNDAVQYHSKNGYLSDYYVDKIKSIILILCWVNKTIDNAVKYAVSFFLLPQTNAWVMVPGSGRGWGGILLVATSTLQQEAVRQEMSDIEIKAINHFISLQPFTCTNVLQQIWLYYIILWCHIRAILMVLQLWAMNWRMNASFFSIAWFCPMLTEKELDLQVDCAL